MVRLIISLILEPVLVYSNDLVWRNNYQDTRINKGSNNELTKQASNKNEFRLVSYRHEDFLNNLIVHMCALIEVSFRFVKGTVSRDFRPLVFFTNQPLLGP
jgi:hypothetical protein